MINIFNDSEGQENFNLPLLCNKLQEQIIGQPVSVPVAVLFQTLGNKLGSHVFRGIIRSVFLIELVKQPKIDSTKFVTRWSNKLQNDPRYASYADCWEIFNQLVQELAAAISFPENRALLELFSLNHLVPYELPLDYIERKKATPRHTIDNIGWMWDSLPKKVVLLRELLQNPTTTPFAGAFKKMYRKKIQVKTYLTDRSLTGLYKTNREKRWETHPQSVQFALRRDCLEIEYALISQLCHFEGAPPELQARLKENDVLLNISSPFLCPITAEPLSFFKLLAEVEAPEHGRAAFQVGHMNPLKASNDDPTFGHTASNISWVSADGNRIQGHLTLKETREMILGIAERYKSIGIES
jgi:hypothetical protein